MSLNYQGFFDESETEGAEFALGGHIAPADAWLQFSKEWEQMLPWGTLTNKGYHFKMSEMAMNSERMSRVQAFYKIIERHVSISVGICMNKSDFDIAKDRIFEHMYIKHRCIIDLGFWDNPYFFSVRAMLDLLFLARKRVQSVIALDEQINLFFDERSEKREIKSVWHEISEPYDNLVKGCFGQHPRFESDNEFLPLQAADFWAWWIREWHEEENRTAVRRMENYDFRFFKGKMRPQICMTLDEQYIYDFLERIAMINLREADENIQNINLKK